MRRISFRGDPFKALRFVADPPRQIFFDRSATLLPTQSLGVRIAGALVVTGSPATHGAPRDPPTSIITAVDVMPSWDVPRCVWGQHEGLASVLSCKPHFSERSRYFHVYIAGGGGLGPLQTRAPTGQRAVPPMPRKGNGGRTSRQNKIPSSAIILIPQAFTLCI